MRELTSHERERLGGIVETFVSAPPSARARMRLTTDAPALRVTPESREAARAAIVEFADVIEALRREGTLGGVADA